DAGGRGRRHVPVPAWPRRLQGRQGLDHQLSQDADRRTARNAVRVSHRLAWLPMAAVTAVLMAILLFLYARTQQRGESDYFENVTLLRHLKQLDAQWELDVLKSRIGINAHYDP